MKIKKNKLVLKSERGSSIIESIFVIKITLILVLILFYFFLISYSKLIMQYILHESLICTIRENNPDFCQREGQKKLNDLLIAGRIKTYKINVQQKSTQGVIKWSLQDYYQDQYIMTENQSISNKIIY